MPRGLPAESRIVRVIEFLGGLTDADDDRRGRVELGEDVLGRGDGLLGARIDGEAGVGAR